MNKVMKKEKNNIYYFTPSDFNLKSKFIFNSAASDFNLKSKFIFNFNDGTSAEYDNFKDLQDFLDKVQKFHDLEKENIKLKEKINSINSQIKALKDNIKFWKHGLYCTTEKSALFHIEKILVTMDEVLKND